MRILTKIILFIICMISFLNLFAEKTDKFIYISKKINVSAEKTENFDKEECYPIEESYKKFVFEARYLITRGRESYAASRYKKHLLCWDDKEIYIELGELYESQEKYFLAGIAYKKGNAKERLTQVIEKQAQFTNANENSDFMILSLLTSAKYLKKHEKQIFFRNAFFVVGPIALATGLGLFIHDKAGGENSLTAQYTLMLGGMSLISGGIFLNAFSKNSLRISQAYGGFSQSFRGDGGTIPDEFFINSGIDAKTKKALAGSYRKNGVGLMLMSIPMFALAIYGFVDSRKYIENKYANEDSGDSVSASKGFDITMSHFFQIFSLAPGLLTLTGGIILIAKASKWEKLNTEPSILTLNSIAPMIDPVLKTYGLSLGFSF